MPRNTRKRVKLLGWLLADLSLAIPALASSAEVTSGDFYTFASGIGRSDNISGHAVMTRLAERKTLVSVHVSGRAANPPYGVHVHNKACNDANAGGH